MNNGSKDRMTYGKRLETAFFTMTKGEFRVCNGKFFSWFDFLTMRKAVLKKIMVKTKNMAKGWPETS